MARINIEDSLLKSSQFLDYCMAVGNRFTAMGNITWLFIEAQKYYLDEGNGRCIPFNEWERLNLDDKLVQFGFVEKREHGYYAKGSEDQFNWLVQRSNAGKAKKTPNRNKPTETKKTVSSRLTTVKRPLTVEEPLTLSLTPTLSPTPTLSLNSNSENTNSQQSREFKTVAKSKLESIYKNLYPLKKGKSKGIESLTRQVRSEKDLHDFEIAVIRYSEDCIKNRTEPRYIKHFSTFANCWRDWLEPETGKSDQPRPMSKAEKTQSHLKAIWNEILLEEAADELKN